MAWATQWLGCRAMLTIFPVEVPNKETKLKAFCGTPSCAAGSGWHGAIAGGSSSSQSVAGKWPWWPSLDLSNFESARLSGDTCQVSPVKAPSCSSSPPGRKPFRGWIHFGDIPRDDLSPWGQVVFLPQLYLQCVKSLQLFHTDDQKHQAEMQI